MSEGMQDPAGLWQVTVDALPFPVFMKDREGRYLACNIAFANHLGIPASGILGKTVFDLAPADLAATYRDADERLIREGGVQVYEAKVRYADGTIHDIRFRKIRLEHPGGRVSGLLGFMEDITERRRVERELSERHAEMAGALQASGDLMFLLDGDLRFLPLPYPHVEEAAAYHMPPAEFLGRTVAEVLPDPPARRVEEIARRVLREGEPEEFAYEIEKDGSRKWFEARAVRMTLDSGRSPRCLIIARDITVRRNAEQALKVHASVIAVMPIGYLLCRFEDAEDPMSLTIRATNAAADTVFGHPGGQLVGRRSCEVFPGLVTSGAIHQFVQVARSHKGVAIPEFVYGDARMPERVYAVKIEPLGDHQLAFLFEDITERKRSEVREEERKALYLDLAENSPDAVYRVSTQGGIEYISAAVEKILGYAPAEMLGKPFAPYLEPGEIPRAMTAFLQAAKGAPTQYLVLAARRKDGSRVMIQVWSTPVVREGRIVGLQGGLRDVSESHRAAEELRATKERLEETHRLARLAEWEWAIGQERMYWSPGFYKLCGLSPEVEPTEAVILGLLHPADREPFQRSVRALVDGVGQPVAEYRLRRPDGEERHISISTTVHFTPEGTPCLMRGILQDITELRTLQRRLAEADAVRRTNSSAPVQPKD